MTKQEQQFIEAIYTMFMMVEEAEQDTGDYDIHDIIDRVTYRYHVPASDLLAIYDGDEPMTDACIMRFEL